MRAGRDVGVLRTTTAVTAVRSAAPCHTGCVAHHVVLPRSFALALLAHLFFGGVSTVRGRSAPRPSAYQNKDFLLHELHLCAPATAPSSLRVRPVGPQHLDRRTRRGRPGTDPVSAPRTEIRSFAELGLAPELLRILTQQGIEAPFPIQQATLPDALSGRDVLGRGRTGSGKTLAFGLPLVQRLTESAAARQPKRPRALILVPTRELANQVHATLQPLAASPRPAHRRDLRRSRPGPPGRRPAVRPRRARRLPGTAGGPARAAPLRSGLGRDHRSRRSRPHG